MEASNVVSIAVQHGTAVSKSRDQAHEQYRKMAHAEIMHALATRGRAFNATLAYDQPAAVAVLEDMVLSQAGVSLLLIDLAQAFARGESMQNMGALAHRMLSGAVTFSANRMADSNDVEAVVNEFCAGDANG